ncbi:hypothetical protein TEQG_04360 [Trichophyton equinum CBS 127.97]|uniref:Uncharacterized protein n=1 Tax=Trichophyton equinum (strain ATCC MYA-4606 / CBS 127.97) TaxID=559882 RepID=F2PTI4_TRIEC|nr:hypothetical protein TEQG_04360 [Trichophyton equinum CBS 127.97]
MAAGIAVELRFLRLLMEVRLEFLPVVGDKKKKGRTQGGEEKGKKSKKGKEQQRRRRRRRRPKRSRQRLTDWQTHDEESDKKTPLLTDEEDLWALATEALNSWLG